jgi:hypothetical protein
MTDSTKQPLRMAAYYYEFAPTGIVEIDRILSAVARAGKAAHHTQDWYDVGVVDPIQDAANAAGAEVTALRERVSLLEGERGRFEHELERINEGGRALDKVIPARVNESKAEHLMRVATEVATLRSQLDEARAQIADMEASPNWLSGHHGEPK